MTPSRPRQHASVLLTMALALAAALPAPESVAVAADELTALQVRRKAQQEQLTLREAELTRRIKAAEDEVGLYSERGDVRFFLGRFADAAADYDKMATLDPELDASHWRRGIAWFYAGEYKQAADQFERYHSFDNVDRENGIWRYLSQHKAHGRDRAREGLLKYEKDDREPFPDVYRLFAGTITPEELLQRIADASIDDNERNKRLFYAELYVGLNYAVEGDAPQARQHLRRAVDNTWGERAGYGPHYMWNVARVHLHVLEEGQGQRDQGARELRKSPALPGKG